MSEAPLMLGVSGLRGIVGESLTPEVATRYAAAFGAWLIAREEGTAVVAIGADGRRGWESVVFAVKAGLEQAGCRVIEVGVVATPTMGSCVDCNGLDAAIIITASHNPQEWNGIKILVCEYATPRQREVLRANPDNKAEWLDAEPGYVFGARAPTSKEATQIIDLFHSSNGKGQQASPTVPDKVPVLAPITDHIEDVSISINALIEDSELNAMAKLSMVVDSVNSSGSRIATAFADEFGCRCTQLHGDNSGIFPHNPEPTAENLSGEGGLCDAVPGLKADVGFAQDPDGDRLAIVDEKGAYIGEEYTLVLAAMSLLEARKSVPPSPTGELSPEATEGASSQTPSVRFAATSPVGDGGGEKTPIICVNLSTSRMIDDVAARYGVRVVRTAVGEANVVEAMKRLKREGHEVVLGGEGNGGVIWPKVTYVRDSLSAMALTLSLMARTGKTVSQLVDDIPRYTILKRKQPLARKELAAPTVAKLAEHYRAAGPGVRVDTQDGVRIDFDATRAWVHVRASNTEPILRLIAEAPTPQLAEAVLDEVQRLVDG